MSGGVGQKPHRVNSLSKLRFSIVNAQRLVQPLLPFTAVNTLLRSLGSRPNRVLDIGCGVGWFGLVLRARGSKITVGADIFLPYLKKAKDSSAYDEVVLCDIRRLPFRDKAFDAVVSMSVLEHLEKHDGLAVLAAMERVARDRVVITVPVGTYEQGEYDENPYQEHRSAWYPREMRNLGYTVRGAGVRCLAPLAAEEQSPIPAVLKALAKIVWVLGGPIAWLWPELGGYMVCSKHLSNKRSSVPLGRELSNLDGT